MFPKICLFWSPHMNGIIQCDLLCLASFTQHKLFKVQPFFLYIYIDTQFIYFIFGCAGSGFSLVVVSGGYSLVEVGVFSLQRLLLLRSTGSVLVAHGLRCSTACGIFLDQGSNLSLLHWQADSLPLSHQGSPSHVTA